MSEKIPRETIQKVLEAGAQAPSGENAQPWKFGIRGDKVYVFNIQERDQSPYNFRQRASFFAHGTLLENITIASSFFGYVTRVELFPEKNNPDLVAIVSFD